MHKPPKNRAPSEIHVGLTDQFERDVIEADVLAFAQVSGDFNPLHIDAAYAAGTNYHRRIVHGAFQVGMASEWVGMYLPGLNVLLSSIHARFVAPLYYPAKVRVSGKIVSWDPLNNSGSAKVTVIDIDNAKPTAEIVLGVSMHERARISSHAVTTDDTKENICHELPGRKLVLLTGASGGVGREIATRLSRHYDVLCQGRDSQRLAQLSKIPGIVPLQCGLGPELHSAVDAIIGNKKLYGVIYAAWPSIPKGGLLNLDDQVIEEQVHFGGVQLISLARLLADRFDSMQGGRLIAVGSTAARYEVVTTQPAYTLGKSVLEDTIRLLATELARKKITANALAPSLVPLGMNAQTQELVLRKAAAQVPMGRLCSIDDILSVIGFLLSEQSEFISGQVIALTGGKR